MKIYTSIYMLANFHVKIHEIGVRFISTTTLQMFPYKIYG